jgi:hypothetical protein
LSCDARHSTAAETRAAHRSRRASAAEAGRVGAASGATAVATRTDDGEIHPGVADAGHSRIDRSGRSADAGRTDVPPAIAGCVHPAIGAAGERECANQVNKINYYAQPAPE